MLTKSNCTFYSLQYQNSTTLKPYWVSLIIGLFLVVYMAIGTQVQAAGPMVHAYLGLQWLEQNGKDMSDQDKQAFMLGTLFPDIRYLIGVPREKTHFMVRSLREVAQGKTAFEKGMRFHSFVDIQRNQFLRTHAVYQAFKKLPKSHRELFIKVVEDEITFNKIEPSVRDTVKLYLAQTHQEEEAFADLSMITKWHLGLTYYFSMLPSSILSQISIFKSGVLMLDAQTVNEWSVSVREYAQNQSYQQYVKDLMNHVNAVIYAHNS